jgi:hypothetical protein
VAAHDHLNPQQFYHGTSVRLRRGAHIKPAREVGVASLYSAMGDDVEVHTHATTDIGNATDYARTDMVKRGSGHVHVYQVTPLGETEPDPGDESSVRSRSPLRVDAEVPVYVRQLAYRDYMNSVTQSRAD